jgi:hypothetical protein
MSDRMLRLVLRLHPAAYRREWGEEIAAVFADTTAGAGRLAAARELLDLAGHGLRSRLGLGSAGRPARLAALAAPFAVGAAAGFTGLELFGTALRDLIHGYPIHWLLQAFSFDARYPLYSLGRLGGTSAALLFLVAALAALGGRWSLTRALMPVALLLTLAGNVLTFWRERGSPLLLVVALCGLCSPQLLWTSVVLAAPRDLLGPTRRRRAVALLAGLLVGGPLMCQLLLGTPVVSLRFALDPESTAAAVAAAEVALIAAAALALRWNRPGLAAAAVAGLPFGLPWQVCLLHRPSPSSLAMLLVELGVVTAAVLVARRARPVEPGQSSPPAVG